MSKREFLDLLRYYLRNYPANIINDIVMDYEEHFRIGLEKGKTEQEISAELGSPMDIANEFLSHDIPPYPNMNPNMNVPPQNPNYQNMPKKKNNSIWWIILIILAVAIFGLPLFGALVGILVAIIGIIVAIFAVIVSLGIAGIASIFAWAFPYPFSNIASVMGIALHPITSVLLGVFLIALSILICYLAIMLLRVCFKGIHNLYLSIRWNIAKRRGK